MQYLKNKTLTFVFYGSILAVLVFMFFYLNIPDAFAQGLGFTPLAELPTPPGDVTPGEGIVKYFQGLFWLGIGIASVLAVLMITIGGIRYMTSEAFTSKQSAKQQIGVAIGGFILAISSLSIKRR